MAALTVPVVAAATRGIVFSLWEVGRGSFENLVEFATIEPHTAARWAVVDFDAGSLGHDERGSVYWTLHFSSPLRVLGVGRL